jgi:TolA-binding protein
MNKKITTFVAGLALAGTVAIGGTAFAAGNGSGGSSTDPTGATGGRAAKICANQATLDQLLQAQITEIQHRIDYFTNIKSIATSAGKTKLADRAQKRIDDLQTRLTKTKDKLSKLDTWAASHCTNGSPNSTTTSTTAA